MRCINISLKRVCVNIFKDNFKIDAVITVYYTNVFLVVVLFIVVCMCACVC